MADKKYPVEYTVDFPEGGISAEEAKAKFGDGAFGLCDAIMFANVLRPDDGSLSVLFVSRDPLTGGEMTPEEYFKIWTLMANFLVNKLPEGGRRNLCEAVVDTIRSGMSRGQLH